MPETLEEQIQRKYGQLVEPEDLEAQIKRKYGKPVEPAPAGKASPPPEVKPQKKPVYVGPAIDEPEFKPLFKDYTELDPDRLMDRPNVRFQLRQLAKEADAGKPGALEKLIDFTAEATPGIKMIARIARTVTGSFARRVLEATDMLGGLSVGSVRSLRDSIKWMYPGKEMYYTTVPPDVSIPADVKRGLTKLLRVKAQEGDVEGAARIGKRLHDMDQAQMARVHWEERSAERAAEVQDNPKKLLNTILEMRRQPGMSYRNIAEDWVTEGTAPALAPMFLGITSKALGVSDKEAALFGIGMTGDIVIDPINLIAVNKLPGTIAKISKKIWGLKSVGKARSVINKLPFVERFKLGLAKGTRTVAQTSVNMGGYPKARRTILKIADEAGRYDFEALVKQHNIHALIGKPEGVVKKGLRDILGKMGLKDASDGILQKLSKTEIDEFADFLGMPQKATRKAKLKSIGKVLEEAFTDEVELKLWAQRNLPEVGQMTYAKVGNIQLKFAPGAPEELIDISVRTQAAREVQKGAIKAAKIAKAKAEVVQWFALDDFKRAKAVDVTARGEVNRVISEVLDARVSEISQALKGHQDSAINALAKMRESRIARKLAVGEKFEGVFDVFRREVVGMDANKIARKYMSRPVTEFVADLTPEMRKIVMGKGLRIDDPNLWRKMTENVIDHASKKPFVGSADLVEMMGHIRRGRLELAQLHKAMPIAVGMNIPKPAIHPRHVRQVGLEAAKDIRAAKKMAAEAVKKGEAAMEEVLRAPLESIDWIKQAKRTPVARNKVAAMLDRSIRLGTLDPKKARTLYRNVQESAKRMDELFRFDYLERARYAKAPKWKPKFGEPRGYFKRLLNPEVRDIWDKMPTSKRQAMSGYFSPAMHKRSWQRGQLISEINFAAEAGEFGTDVQRVALESGLWITNPQRVIAVTMDETARVVQAYRITKLATTLEAAGGVAKDKIQLGKESMAKIKAMKVKYPDYDIYLPSKEWAKHAHELDTVSDGMVKTINQHGALIPVDANVLTEVASLKKPSFGYLVPKPLARQLNYNFQSALSLRETNNLVHAYDRVMNLWRGQALMWPSYHMRNLIGGNLGNMLAFGFKNPGTFGTSWRDMRKVFNKGWGALDDVSRTRMLAARDRGVFTSWFAYEVQKVTGKMSPIQKMIQANRNVGVFTENMSKYAMFIDAVNQGKNFDEAANLALKAMHRYHDIPPAIAKLRRWGMPFVTWSYKNIPLQLEVAIRNPRYFATLNKGIQNISAAMGTEEETKRLKQLGIVTKKGEDGQLNVMLFSNFLPVADLEIFDDPIDEITMNLSPLWKIAGSAVNVDLNRGMRKIYDEDELRTRRLFMGQPLSTEYAPVRGMLTTIGSIRMMNYADSLIRRNYGDDASDAWQEACGAFIGLYTRKQDEKWALVDEEERKRWAIFRLRRALERKRGKALRRPTGEREIQDIINKMIELGR